jgi:hypothetical protein
MSPIERLKTAREFTADQVETVIKAHLIRRVADFLLRAAPELFAHLYYNSPLFPLLRSHADAALVRMHAMLCGRALCRDCRPNERKQPGCTNENCGRSWTDGFPIRGLVDLTNHRDAICHPFAHQLTRKRVVKFTEDRRHTRDLQAALVWDIHRSLNEALTAAGDPHSDLDIAVRGDTTYQLDVILRRCWKPGVAPASEQALKDWLEEAWRKDRAAFARYPDGQLPKKTEKEMTTNWRAFVKEWEASR